MCGIAGILHFDTGRKIDEQQLLSMRDVMVHRGPDGAGHYINGTVGLAHRRLSILDLSENGKQPFASADERYHITFNGEIYNFRELRKDLEAQGWRFRSQTDTEVLLNLYIHEGPAMLDKLNGMFAFVIWDNVEKTLFIARDRLGVKPCYYAVSDNTFYFASEQKSILRAGVSRQLHEEQLAELLQFRFIAGEHTLFKHIHKLLPGHYMFIKDGRITTRRWWHLGEKIAEKRNTLPQEPFGWFEEYVKSSVQYRMISDVPVGLLLSGGLDSSSVAATLHDLGYQDLSSFTVAFDEKEYNEGNLASQVARTFNLNYHEITVTGEELHKQLTEAAWFHDEPLIHQNDAQMLAISKYAKKHVTVLLSGEASDELMGGYVRYKPLNYLRYRKVLQMASPMLKMVLPGKRVNKLNEYLSIGDAGKQVLYNSASIYPGEFRQMGVTLSENAFSFRMQKLEEAQMVFGNDFARQAMYLDQHTFLCSLLDRNDRMTMGASIECRVPFLDYRLVEQVSAMPSSLLFKGKKGKFLLYNSIGKKLPQEVRQFKKWGFGVPWGKYLKEQEVFRNTLEEMKSNEIWDSSIFSQIPVKKLISGFLHDEPGTEAIVRQLLMVHIWTNQYYTKFR
jgi:asparagine synthase (glutamine-hydrolysing)